MSPAVVGPAVVGPAAVDSEHRDRSVFRLLTCEHAGCRVPGELAVLFAGREAELASHRGWDPGALELAGHLAVTLGAPLYFSRVSRLVVELNRSEQHPRLFSEHSRSLPRQQRQRLLERYHRPFRRAVEASVRRRSAEDHRVLHLSVHTFTPVWQGWQRRTDLGLLYDPSRAPERDLAAAWKRELARRLPGWTIRRNHPYRGVADGHTTHLRKLFGPGEYLGLELEVSQRLVLEDPAGWRRLLRELPRAFVSPFEQVRLIDRRTQG